MKDNKITIYELKEKVKSFCEVRDWDQYHNAKELSIALSIESAELLELFRWKTREECDALFDDPKKREEIEDELADNLYFILRLSQRYDIDLSESLKRKIKKNDSKYPVEKVKGSNKKYTEL